MLGFIGTLLSIVLWIVLFIVGLVLTIIQGIPLYRMSKRKGVNHAWLSFLPLGNTWIMLQLPSSQFNLLGLRSNRNSALWKVLGIMVLLYIPVVIFSGGDLSFIGSIFSLLFYAYSLLFTYRLIKDVLDTYSNGKTVGWTIASMFIPFVFTIALYMLMNRVSANECYPNMN